MPALPFDINISVDDKNWTLTQAHVTASIHAVWSLLTAPKTGELSIALINDAQIQTLNKDYRGKDKTTNVLSFPTTGPAPCLGDIALSYETIVREAQAAGKDLEHHITHLLIHGFLHLQGYDHETDEEAAQMEALEIKALAQLGIDNPYEIGKT